MSAETITKDEIQKLALDSGFTTRRQPDGSIDLNPYVYQFAKNLLLYSEAKTEGPTEVLNDDLPTLSLDFDGVLHSYTSGWQGADVIADGPVEGAMAFLTDAVEKFNVCIFSTRNEHIDGIHAMRDWLDTHLREHWETLPHITETVLARLRFPTHKPKAVVYIDDRGYRFEGSWPDLDSLMELVPWNKTSS